MRTYKLKSMKIDRFNNKKFELFGTTYVIKVVGILANNDNMYQYGITYNAKKEIHISKKVGDSIQPESEVYLTLVHEIVHCILDAGQYNEESQNEALVEWLSRCIVSLLKQKILVA